ncbi:MAG TPA: bifunctional phosphoribosylaminoimidazolecarboxamide formyltransferase/IMP cyclohydrolase [Planctomycetota bacterium]|nr:bifunctional phosphoribosylaminoimidazolecarboxamide formyltransferase/IMP cyclohydrolase [Planctomycetota bacterium]
MSGEGLRVRRALVSVSDKRGVVDLARALASRGAEILSTGGTYRTLRGEGVAAREVSDATGFPEMMDGRIKTLHPRVHGGLLARRDQPEHVAAMKEHGIEPIDLLCVNLYPFEETVARPGVSHDEAIEQIDIGGPAMVRSAAKNHRFVAVVTDPDDYGPLLREIETFGEISLATRERLARKAFALTARYDATIARFLETRGGEPEPFPRVFALRGAKVADLRYGENPHQRAAFYRIPGAREASVATATVRNGKELSYNNILDLDAALALVRELDGPAVAVIKHTNPCGCAIRERLADAARAAWEGDPVSAFGSVVAVNRPLDLATAELLTAPDRFVECVIAPSFDEDAIACLKTRPKWGASVRLLETGPFGPRDPDPFVRSVAGGFLVQDRNLAAGAGEEHRVPTKRAPTPAEKDQLAFAASVCKHVKSNAIVLARDLALVGAGAGQMSRVDSVRIAVDKAGPERARGSVLASDAFFPFADGVELAARAGVTAILQPGGSKRDAEVIAAADRAGVAMVFTGTRHFLH